MTMNLTCTQVSALLSFYIDDKLNVQLKQFVEAHLEICPACKAKLETLKNMVNSLKEAHRKLEDMKPEQVESLAAASENSQHDAFKVSLSAYIDNELDDEENIKIKKYIVSNPKARAEIENLYKLKRILNSSFEKAKHDARDDYSKYILKRIDIQEEVYGPDSFVKVMALCILLLAVFTLTAMIIFWV